MAAMLGEYRPSLQGDSKRSRYVLLPHREVGRNLDPLVANGLGCPQLEVATSAGQLEYLSQLVIVQTISL
jgi:hypothetical protein